MSELKIGDKVTWTHTTQNGTRISFKSKSGRIIKLGASFVTVVRGNGRKDNIHRYALRKEGDKSTLTEFFENLVKASKESEQ